MASAWAWHCRSAFSGRFSSCVILMFDGWSLTVVPLEELRHSSCQCCRRRKVICLLSLLRAQQSQVHTWALRIAAEVATLRIVIHPADLTRWTFRTDTRRAVWKTRRMEHVLLQLFIHREWLANKDEEQRSDVTIDYHDSELEVRRGIRRQRSSSEN